MDMIETAADYDRRAVPFLQDADLIRMELGTNRRRKNRRGVPG